MAGPQGAGMNKKKNRTPRSPDMTAEEFEEHSRDLGQKICDNLNRNVLLGNEAVGGGIPLDDPWYQQQTFGDDPEPRSPPVLEILRAVAFAADKHRDQRRKDEGLSPYINHPVAVAEHIGTLGGVFDVATLQAAVLHDTIEDTETSREELEQRFGAEVAGLVVEVTDDKSLEKAVRKQRQLEHAPQLSPRAKLIKIADKLCNVEDIIDRPPASWSLERRLEYLAHAEAVVTACGPVNGPLVAAFRAAMARGRSRLGSHG